MFPYKSSILLDRKAQRNLYLQLCDQMIKHIKSGKLPPATRLPGTRTLANDLQIHRKTVIAAYDELIAQGWIETLPSRGTYVNRMLPIVNPADFDRENSKQKTTTTSPFSFLKRPNLMYRSVTFDDSPKIQIDDGSPDHRLAPIEELSKTYRNIAKKSYHQNLFAYGSTYGNLDLREKLVKYLNQTRGLNISLENILITRGSQMGIYLASQLLFNKRDTVVVGNTNYLTANYTFEEAGATIAHIPVDDQGIDTNAMEALCKKTKVKAIYVTSHHHHPTTVTLSAERRMHLLQLAKQYGFAIIEDDYDYDFHYSNAPILPLASNDNYGNVIYIGGFTKIIAPAMRIGYLIAPKDFIDEASNMRRIIDRQGDMVLEKTMSQLIKAGDIQRHTSKVLKIYKSRRDLFCSLLKERLSNYFEFEVPKGGLAVWVTLNNKYNWDDVVAKAGALKLELNPEWRRYDSNNLKHNSIRMGFASLNEEEIRKTVIILEEVCAQL